MPYAHSGQKTRTRLWHNKNADLKVSIFPIYSIAERKGFEPSIRFPVYTLSRRAPSTTRTPLCLLRPVSVGGANLRHPDLFSEYFKCPLGGTLYHFSQLQSLHFRQTLRNQWQKCRLILLAPVWHRG